MMIFSKQPPWGKTPREGFPHSQGTLDGMCGPYAIANALLLCGVDRGEEIIRIACAAVSKRRWPDIYWNGTTFRDLQRMLLACRHALRVERLVRIDYPLRDRPARNAKHFWDKFDAAFRDPDTACAIIGITSPAHHWLVVRKDGGRIIVVDSAPRATIYRKNRAGFSVGRPRKFRATWVIERRVMIVVRVVPPPTATSTPIGKNRRLRPRTKKMPRRIESEAPGPNFTLVLSKAAERSRSRREGRSAWSRRSAFFHREACLPGPGLTISGAEGRSLHQLQLAVVQVPAGAPTRRGVSAGAEASCRHVET